MATMEEAQAAGKPFLPMLTEQFTKLQQQAHIDTAGMFFQFAKSEMSGKVDSLREAKDQQPTLKDVVQHCVEEKTLTVKNSTARNLHRLVSALDFIKVLMANLAKDTKMTLHNACYDAYNKTMAHIHTFVVRTAVKAGMYTLPTRDVFLKTLGAHGDAAKTDAEQFVAVAEKFTDSVLVLYEGTSMPRSDSTWTG